MKRKKKKQEKSGRDGDVLGDVNARASARSLISGGLSRGGVESSRSNSGSMQIECNQIEFKLVSSLVEPKLINQQSNELGTRSGANELIALSIVSGMQDQSNKQMPELGGEQVKTVDGEKSLERAVHEQSLSSLVLSQSVGADRGCTRMFVRTRVPPLSRVILALMGDRIDRRC